MLEEIKNYLRIDFHDDDTLLEMIIETAKEYIKNAVGYIDLEKTSFKILLFSICSDLYEKRSYLIDNQINSNKIINSLILQLQLQNDN